uniref:Uncharacterized protein n=1 Tax=Anguilla anguilla TaxID=7936 RepID=A0A0E9SXZ6_ANGAN
MKAGLAKVINPTGNVNLPS